MSDYVTLAVNRISQVAGLVPNLIIAIGLAFVGGNATPLPTNATAVSGIAAYVSDPRKALFVGASS